MMHSLRAKIPFLAGLAVLIGLGAAVTERKSPFSPHQKAFYMTPEQVSFVRPGLVLKILTASIDADGKIQVRFKVTDPRGLALDRLGVSTPGVVGTSWVAAVIPNNGTQYTAYTTRVVTSPITRVTATQAGSDAPAGTYQQVGDGEYTYTFTTRAPATIDRTATHSIGVYANRNLTEFDLGTQYSNDVFNFVPNGSTVTKVRAIVKTESCNRCHDPLGLHGGSRQKVELCILCHQPQTTDPDTGNTVDLPVLIHKIHRGEDLPSVVAGTPYHIIGNAQNDNDYSHVVFPADVRRCEVCHEQGTGAAPQAANYLLKPSRAACGACHDDVNFATGAKHGGDELPQISDNQCATCHTPEGELEFDASIKGAHTIPTHAKGLPGTIWDITRVTNTGPGQKPTVQFTIKDKNNVPITPTEMTRLALVMGGSTADYASYVSEDARTATGTGTYSYTFQQALPANATGTWAVGIEGYRNVTLLPGTKKEMVVRDAGINKVSYFGVTDATPKPRRAVVAQANCQKCHESLELHGGNRNRVEQCVICHNANETDAVRRPAAQNPVESVHFKTMIHKIHTGEELGQKFTIYGFGGTANEFGEVLYPGDRRNCAACHVNNSERVPLPEGLLPSKSPRDLLEVKEPITAACLSCHVSRSAHSHALSNTTRLGEACEACHGNDAEFSVTRVHARNQ
jgi:OmcA/MtrC family decaheme c-type cytochrome